MKFDWIDPDFGPTPEQLGAYADGELTGAARAAVEDWLHGHPAQAAEVDDLRQVTQLWRETPPPPPAEGAWSCVRGQIAARLSKRPTPPPKTSPRFGMVAAAAAILALVLVGKGELSVQADQEPYAVVDPSDVAIMSIDGDDCKCLVAAQCPVCQVEECDLAMPDDVLVLNVEEHKDRTVAVARYDDGPMMFTPPLGWERKP